MTSKIFSAAVLLGAVAWAASVELKDAGTWTQTEHNEGTYSTNSLNAWFDVLTTEDAGQPIKKVYIEVASLDENYTVSDWFGVYATKRGFDAATKKDLWHAEVRIKEFFLWTVMPTEVQVNVKADVGEQYGSKLYLYDEQNPHFLIRPMNAANPIRFRPETLRVKFEESVGPVVTGVVRVWDPKPSQLDKTTVEVRYTVDGWRTVKSVFATKGSFPLLNTEFEFRVDKLTKTASATDLVEQVEFAFRFVNSNGAEFWDNNDKQNYVQRLLPVILAPTVHGSSDPLTGEVRIDFNVALDSKFSTASVERVGSSEGPSDLSIVFDTSVLSNGATAKFVVRASAFGKASVEKTFEYKVFNSLVKESISLPEGAKDFWNIAVSPANSSQLLLSSLGSLINSNDFAVYDREARSVLKSGKFGGDLVGDLVADASDSENLYVLSQLRLTKVLSSDVSTVVYTIDLGVQQFCFPKSVAFSNKFVFVMDSCGGKVVVFDKSSGALKATISQGEGLDQKFPGAIVSDREADAVYVFANSVVYLINTSNLRVEKTWKGDSSPREAVLSRNGLFWTYEGGAVVQAVQLTDDLTVKTVGKFISDAQRVLSGIVGLAEEEAALIVDVQTNQLLKFSLPNSAPLVM